MDGAHTEWVGGAHAQWVGRAHAQWMGRAHACSVKWVGHILSEWVGHISQWVAMGGEHVVCISNMDSPPPLHFSSLPLCH